MLQHCLLLFLLFLHNFAHATALKDWRGLTTPDFISMLAKRENMKESLVTSGIFEEMNKLVEYKDSNTVPNANEQRYCYTDNQCLDEEITALLSVNDFADRFPRTYEIDPLTEHFNFLLVEHLGSARAPYREEIGQLSASYDKLSARQLTKTRIETVRRVRKVVKEVMNEGEELSKSLLRKLFCRMFHNDKHRQIRYFQSLSNDDERMIKYLQFQLAITGLEFQQTERVVREARWIVTLKNAIDLNFKFAVANLIYYGNNHQGNWNAFDAYYLRRIHEILNDDVTEEAEKSATRKAGKST